MTMFAKVLKSSAAVAVASCAALLAQGVFAADAVTTSPTKVYAAVGGSFTFTVTLPAGNATSTTDLLVSYTANTTSPAITPYAQCIDAATPSPYDGAPANSKYVNWDAGLAIFPSAAACGSQSGAITLATFSGVASTIPSGAYTIQVLNGFANADTNVTSNDVTICQKTTVSSVSAPADAFEGTAQTFTVNFASAVPTGCGGFAIPVALTGTATAAPDNVVITTNNCASVAAGASSCTVVVQGVDDTALDGNKVATLTVTDSTASDVYISAGKTANANVLDNEVGASVASTTANASETGPTNGVFTFTRTGVTTSSLNLVSAISGTATYTADYSITAGTCAIAAQSAASITVTVPAGSASCTVNIVPVDDVVVEGPETVIFGVPTGSGVAGTGSAATVTIADNDTPPVFSLAQAGACAEPSANCTFTITRDSGIAASTTVNFTVAGTATRSTTGAAGSGDYYLALTSCVPANVIAGNSVTHPNASPLPINVCVLDDLLVEGPETVIMTLTANPPTYTVGTASQTQSIADDDSPQVVTVAVNGPVSEAGGVLTYTFTRSGGSAAAQAATLSVNTTAPATSSRYSTTCGASITFAASTSTATCTVTAIDNVAVDGNVTATVAVAAPTVAGAYTVGSPSSATGTINDDDVAVNAVAGNTGSATSAGIVEGGIARFSVSCPTLTSAFTVNYSITPAVPATGDAFVGGGATGSVTCPVGAAGLVAVPTTVQTLDDTVIGNTRTYTMTISVPTAQPAPAATVIGNAVAVVSVADNDRPLVIPTMGAIGLGLMSLMLAGLAAFQRRRRA